EPEPPQDSEPKIADNDMDDLAALIGTPSSGDSVPEADEEKTNSVETKGEEDMDDLFALVEGPGENASTEEEAPAQAPPEKPEEPTPSIKPGITPQEDMGKYKAEIMKIMIQMKKDGLTAEETAQRFNGEGVQTLSGKPEWSVKAISKIYSFIDAAK
ncbi:MAG: hypothetical protein MI747_02470, partial [Desulfobacterales bacterium]|nr:hypothetical protein [Desulfobacterales bacterium]